MPQPRVRLLLSLLICVLASLGCAVAADPAPETLSAGQVLRGHFVQNRQLTGFAKPLRSEGSFVLMFGRGLIWRGEKPFANTTIITSDGILQMANGQEAMRLSASRLPGLAQLYQALSAALSGNTKPLLQTFSVTQSGEPSAWRVELKPLHPENDAMSQLKALVMTGGRYVESVEVDRAGGDVDRITFSAHKVTKNDLSADEASLLKAVRK